MMSYKKLEVKEDVVCQYVGVYVTRWQQEWGEPTVAFVEIDSEPEPTKSESKLIQEILDEVERAVIKFPEWPTDPIHAANVLAEEVGELHKEVLQLTYEPHKSNKDAVRVEALQSAAMALRFLMSLDNYKYVPGEQHVQDSIFLLLDNK